MNSPTRPQPIAASVTAAHAMARSQSSTWAPGRKKPNDGANSARKKMSAQVPKRSLRTPGPIPDSNMPSASAPADRRDRGLTLIRRFEPEEIGDRFALSDQLDVPVCDEHGRRPRDAVVVRGHREGVAAGRGHREQVAALRLR